MVKRKSKPSKAVESQFENDPTPERLRHAGGISEDFKTDTSRKCKRLNSIIDHMLGRHMIDAPLYAVAFRMQKMSYDAGFAALGAVDLSRVRVDGGGGFDLQQFRIDNANRFGDAMAAIGPHSSRVFREMVLHEMAAHEFGFRYCGLKDREYASRKAYDLLIVALQALEVHLTGGKRAAHSPMQSHMVDDGKPSNRPDER